jgi:hypothetical protein
MALVKFRGRYDNTTIGTTMCIDTSTSNAEVVYPESDMALNDKDREEIRRLIVGEMKPKRWPEWLKESIVLTVVMAGGGFMMHEYIPARIGSQTALMGTDIVSLRTSLDAVKGDVTEIKKDI